MKGPQTHTVIGLVGLTDADTATAGCVGAGGYSDITPGAEVILTNQSGKILGATGLSAGVAAVDLCQYTFTIHNVPDDQAQYAVEVTHRGKVVKSKAEMQASNWTIELTIGS